MWSIWFLVCPSLEDHVTRWRGGCWKRVLVTTRRFAHTIFIRRLLLAHLVSRATMPRICRAAMSTEPGLALQSPVTISTSPAGTVSSASWRSSWNESLTSSPVQASLHLMALQLKQSLPSLRGPEQLLFTNTPSLSVWIQVTRRGRKG